MMRDQPNVVVFNTDQQRADCLGCAGSPVKTPTIDSVASDGRRFTNAFVTSPLCSPSRASIFTGRYPHEHGVYGNDIPLPENQPTFVEALSRVGYETSLYGKWHLGVPKTNHSGRLWRDAPPGFDEFLTTMEHDVPDNQDPDYLSYLKSEGVIGSDAGENAWRDPEGEFQISELGNSFSPMGASSIPEEHYMTTWLVDNAVRYIKDREDADDPFYLQISGFYPHFPIAPPKPYDDLYDPAEVKLPESRLAETFEDKPSLESSTIAREHYEQFSEDDLRRAWALTYGLCTFIDKQFGRIIDALEETDLREDTVVVFVSDHGEMLGSHGLLWKGPFMYDEILRVPLVISHSDVESGVSDGLVSLLDLGPTLAELGGTEMPDATGRSFAPMLYGERTDHRSLVFAEYLTNPDTFGAAPENPIYMARGRRFKFAETIGQGSVLYDLDEQPVEVTNHASEAKYAPIEQTLKNKTKRLRPDNL